MPSPKKPASKPAPKKKAQAKATSAKDSPAKRSPAPVAKAPAAKTADKTSADKTSAVKTSPSKAAAPAIKAPAKPAPKAAAVAKAAPVPTVKSDAVASEPKPVDAAKTKTTKAEPAKAAIAPSTSRVVDKSSVAVNSAPSAVVKATASAKPAAATDSLGAKAAKLKRLQAEAVAAAETPAPVAEVPAKPVEASKPAPAKPAAAAKPAAKAPSDAKAASDKGKSGAHRSGYRPNEFIVYPAHGVGQIVAIEEQEVAGYKLELFVINFSKDKMTLKVPLPKVMAGAIRKLADDAMVTRALTILTGRARIKRTMWSRRAQEYEAKINSGDLGSIAEVVRDLYRSEAQPEQSYSERQLYEAALDRMGRELAAVQKLTDTEALKAIDTQLQKGPRRLSKAEAAEAEAETADETDVDEAA